MTDQEFSPATDDEFHELLAALIHGARANGVNVCGGWDAMVRSSRRSERLGIEIYRVGDEDDGGKPLVL